MPAVPTPAHGPTILVVDDEPSVLKLTAALLEADGYHVLQAGGSVEALKFCTTYAAEIDLLIADLVLHPRNLRLAARPTLFPNVHGHELALRSAAIRKGLRILMMSGNPGKELAGYGIHRGDLPFIQKPFEKETFAWAIREVLNAPPPPWHRDTRTTSQLTEEDMEVRPVPLAVRS
jgi:CheY-like chemotaxis protein